MLFFCGAFLICMFKNNLSDDVCAEMKHLNVGPNLLSQIFKRQIDKIYRKKFCLFKIFTQFIIHINNIHYTNYDSCIHATRICLAYMLALAHYIYCLVRLFCIYTCLNLLCVKMALHNKYNNNIYIWLNASNGVSLLFVIF
jgi:hypothetical protein